MLVCEVWCMCVVLSVYVCVVVICGCSYDYICVCLSYMRQLVNIVSCVSMLLYVCHILCMIVCCVAYAFYIVFYDVCTVVEVARLGVFARGCPMCCIDLHNLTCLSR